MRFEVRQVNLDVLSGVTKMVETAFVEVCDAGAREGLHAVVVQGMAYHWACTE
jgi:hypothetical protein